jgi:hypothetical protein
VINHVDAAFSVVFWMETFWTVSLVVLAVYFALQPRR